MIDFSFRSYACSGGGIKVSIKLNKILYLRQNSKLFGYMLMPRSIPNWVTKSYQKFSID
uniref:Uncharacterized protein n=1 Tax=Rhizophora mucronata TaxID=61149 RepID=A0A2P2JAR1_RHIMU